MQPFSLFEFLSQSLNKGTNMISFKLVRAKKIVYQKSTLFLSSSHIDVLSIVAELIKMVVR